MSGGSLEQAFAAAALTAGTLRRPQMQLILQLWGRGILDEAQAGQRIGWELVRCVDWDKVGQELAFAAQEAKNEALGSPTSAKKEAAYTKLPNNTNLGIFSKVREWLKSD